MKMQTVLNRRMSTPHPKYSEFEALLNAYMKLNGFNDTALSSALKSKTYISKIRKRRSLPGQAKMLQLAELFNVNVSDLLPGAALPDADKKPPTPHTSTATPEKIATRLLDGPVTITPAQMRDASMPTLRIVIGDGLADEMRTSDFTEEAVRCASFVNAESPKSTKELTSHLTAYILGIVTATAARYSASLQVDEKSLVVEARRSARWLADFLSDQNLLTRDRKA